MKDKKENALNVDLIRIERKIDLLFKSIVEIKHNLREYGLDKNIIDINEKIKKDEEELKWLNYEKENKWNNIDNEMRLYYNEGDCETYER